MRYKKPQAAHPVKLHTTLEDVFDGLFEETCDLDLHEILDALADYHERLASIDFTNEVNILRRAAEELLILHVNEGGRVR